MEPNTRCGSTCPIFLVLVLLGASLLALPTATAQVEIDITYNIVSLERLELDATASLSDEVAQEIRGQADTDGDGRVDASEADAFAAELEEEEQGPSEDVSLDGNPARTESLELQIHGLEGATDSGSLISVVLHEVATLEPGPGPEHTFVADGLASTEEEQQSITVLIPEGASITETSGLDQRGGCEAGGSPSEDTASVSFEEGGGGCESKGSPGFGMIGAIMAVCAAAFVVGRAG